MGRLKLLGGRIGRLDTRIAHPPRKTADPFYLTPEWRRLMDRIIAVRGRRCEDPQCEVPGGRRACRLFGDHVVELKDGGAPLDPKNIMLRCGSCHTRKTLQARADRMRG
jgi:5-methylcytosine-specific restriction protein A